MTTTGKLTETEGEAWRAFLRAHYQVVRKLDADLLAKEGLSLSAFEVLRWLETTEGRMRMSELADRVLLSRSGMTRLVDHLVTQGLIERQRCLDDARGAEAVLTAAGKKRLAQVSKVHFEAVKTFFTDRLDKDQLESVAQILSKIVDPEIEGC